MGVDSCGPRSILALGQCVIYRHFLPLLYEGQRCDEPRRTCADNDDVRSSLHEADGVESMETYTLPSVFYNIRIGTSESEVVCNDVTLIAWRGRWKLNKVLTSVKPGLRREATFTSLGVKSGSEIKAA